MTYIYIFEAVNYESYQSVKLRTIHFYLLSLKSNESLKKNLKQLKTFWTNTHTGKTLANNKAICSVLLRFKHHKNNIKDYL